MEEIIIFSVISVIIVGLTALTLLVPSESYIQALSSCSYCFIR
jgi:hypothetical protein